MMSITSAQSVRFVILLLIAVVLYQCATPMAPTGGEIDERPPGLDSLRSTPNLQTNFRPQQIELTFDEWVKLDRANEQIIISPPVQGFSTRLKKKTVIVDMGDKDTLRNNVTYVIQFGQAVQDLTESNPAENLRFVFSTGDYIDSLEVHGEVLDAYTGVPVENALVMLYANLVDTAFRTERPFYFSRTDEKGAFNISNIREGQFQVTALQDVDANYRFSQVNEPIAFLEAPIVINSDSSQHLSLRLFTEATLPRINDVDSSRFGLLRLAFNTPPIDQATWQSTVELTPQVINDSLLLWYQSEQNEMLYIQHDTFWRDTISLPKATLTSAANQLAPMSIKKRTTSNAGIYPRRGLELQTDRPLSAFDTTFWQFNRDTFPENLAFRMIEIDSSDQTVIQVMHNWQEKSNYNLSILPGGLTDAWGVTSTDTLVLNWRVNEEKQFGNMKFRFEAADTSKQYYIKVVKGDKPPVATFLLNGQTRYETFVNGLPSGEYQLEIIEDRNRNGRWDTGHFDRKEQPERVYIQTLEELRASWDIETVVDLSDLFEHSNH